jgi:hypothetical protein
VKGYNSTKEKERERERERERDGKSSERQRLRRAVTERESIVNKVLNIG